MPDNAAMNRMIVSSSPRAARAAEPSRRDAMFAALAEIETATKRGSDVDREMAEARLDRVLEDGRAAETAAREAAEAKAAEQRRAEALREPPVRSTTTAAGLRRQHAAFHAPPTPGARTETAGQLFNRAMAQSRFERAERGDDERLIRINR